MITFLNFWQYGSFSGGAGNAALSDITTSLCVTTHTVVRFYLNLRTAFNVGTSLSTFAFCYVFVFGSRGIASAYYNTFPINL